MARALGFAARTASALGIFFGSSRQPIIILGPAFSSKKEADPAAGAAPKGFFITLRAYRQGGVDDFLEGFHLMAAGIAFVSVGWHKSSY